MSIWILAGSIGDRFGAVLIDSVTETAFGPMFWDGSDAERFLTWAKREELGDLRALSARILAQMVADFRKGWTCDTCDEVFSADECFGGSTDHRECATCESKRIAEAAEDVLRYSQPVSEDAETRLFEYLKAKGGA